MAFTIIHWIDLFTGLAYCDILLESLRYCQANKSVFGNFLPGIIRDFKKHTSKKIVKAVWLKKTDGISFLDLS